MRWFLTIAILILAAGCESSTAPEPVPVAGDYVVSMQSRTDTLPSTPVMSAWSVGVRSGVVGSWDVPEANFVYSVDKPNAVKVSIQEFHRSYPEWDNAAQAPAVNFTASFQLQGLREGTFRVKIWNSLDPSKVQTYVIPFGP